jgi:excisionase family DNA binding protein
VSDAVTVTEAARRLGVSRSKVWSLLREGSLQAYQNPLDRRQRLIPEEALQRVLEQTSLPRRPVPRILGIFADPTIQSDELEDYMAEHWHSE